jgi:hypothetical protein
VEVVRLAFTSGAELVPVVHAWDALLRTPRGGHHCPHTSKYTNRGGVRKTQVRAVYYMERVFVTGTKSEREFRLLRCLSFSVCREFGFIAIQMWDKNPTLRSGFGIGFTLTLLLARALPLLAPLLSHTIPFPRVH